MFNLRRGLNELLEAKLAQPSVRLYDEISDQVLAIFDEHALRALARNDPDLLAAYHAVAMENKVDLKDLKHKLQLPDAFEDDFKTTDSYRIFKKFWEMHNKMASLNELPPSGQITELVTCIDFMANALHVPEYEIFLELSKVMREYFHKREGLAYSVRKDLVKQPENTNKEPDINFILESVYGHTGKHDGTQGAEVIPFNPGTKR